MMRNIHCVKNVFVLSFSGPYFSAFGLYTDQKNSEYGYFLRSDTKTDKLNAKIVYTLN